METKMYFFEKTEGKIFAIQVLQPLSEDHINTLCELLDTATMWEGDISGSFIGPRKEFITPFSTNAVEITQNAGIPGIIRIEELHPGKISFDPMLQQQYNGLNDQIFLLDKLPDSILQIKDIAAYNAQEGLALSGDEINYLQKISEQMGRLLTDSEIFGFAQANSEHCRHKIFNGTFIIDGQEKHMTLFQMIKQTSKENPTTIISAYKDNCAFMKGPQIWQFAPNTKNGPAYFESTKIDSIISLKAETHNFPTTVEPFNGAATGSGGEIRDRFAGGKGSFPLIGTAVYMTAYPRLDKKSVTFGGPDRPWLYQTPQDILIKASNGASDFGNKFGQPLICGSVLTFEHFEKDYQLGYDKVIMMAGGVGYANKKDAFKETPKEGNLIILLGGDNYRIGIGGGAVSSVETGNYGKKIELNAVQRANAEMQKRVYNVVRALAEMENNPIVSIHDHGAGGHFNCLSELVEEVGGVVYIDKLPVGDKTLSELVEEVGGVVYIDKLPVGDKTLSAKEIIGNESQERMGMIIKKEDVHLVEEIADRERCPMYIVGYITGDGNFVFENSQTGKRPIDMNLKDLFGNPPKTTITDITIPRIFGSIEYTIDLLEEYLSKILNLESVGCKDWLTNKVDRSVTGRISTQQTVGELQLPLNNLGVVALDYISNMGIATAIGHSPISGLIDAKAGSVLSVAEALTNIIWTPIEGGIHGISLSANWMWPCNNPGEDARLYQAVEAMMEFTIALGIPIPTGKDSLSMVQKYPDGTRVMAPGTVIVSAEGVVRDICKTVQPCLINDADTHILYIDFSKSERHLGGTSFAQACNHIGDQTSTVTDPMYFIQAFNVIQELIEKELILSGHDIAGDGMLVSLLEMLFANTKGGMMVSLDAICADPIKACFSNNPGVIIQVKDIDSVSKIFENHGVHKIIIGHPIQKNILHINHSSYHWDLPIPEYRNIWYNTSVLMDMLQTANGLAGTRYANYDKQLLSFCFPDTFVGTFDSYGIHSLSPITSQTKAAIIREKGSNGEIEMAWMLELAGFDVKNVHMTDLVSGKETLEDINLIVFVGGFSNSDVLGSAKGWAAACKYNPKAKQTLDNFLARPDTLSLGVCNGCQLMVALGWIPSKIGNAPQMTHNDSHKFESGFVNVTIPKNHSVMLGSLSGSRLGIWVAHGECKFYLPGEKSDYHIAMKYSYNEYPGNPNGSDYSTAAICSDDGRHLAMMPHLERSTYPWNWAHYPSDRKNDEVTPWIEAFVNARKWIENKVNM